MTATTKLTQSSRCPMEQVTSNSVQRRPFSIRVGVAVTSDIHVDSSDTSTNCQQRCHSAYHGRDEGVGQETQPKKRKARQKNRKIGLVAWGAWPKMVIHWNYGGCPLLAAAPAFARRMTQHFMPLSGFATLNSSSSSSGCDTGPGLVLLQLALASATFINASFSSRSSRGSRGSRGSWGFRLAGCCTEWRQCNYSSSCL